MRRFFIAILFVLSAGFSFSQEITEEEEVVYANYPTTIPEKLSPVLEGDFKLPTPIFNKAFRKIGNGIADINLLFQYPLTKNLLFGGGFKYGYFQFVDFLTNNSFSNSGKLYTYSPFGRVSWLKFTTPRLFFQFSAKAGYTIMNFNSFTCTNIGEGAISQSSFFIEPQISAHIFVDESLSFGLVISDYIAFNSFNPSLMCLETFSGFNPSDSEGNYNVFAVGFGFTYFFNKRGAK